jgi:hypothetical protein
MPSRKMYGKGIASEIKDLVIRSKLISRGLNAVGNPFFSGSAAGMLGYGRKRRVTRRKQVGRGIFGDFGSGVGSVFGGVGNGVGSFAHGMFGG